jgi:hypothetical protein
MHKLVLPAAVCVAFVGAALAQVEASSSTYLLDVDTARYVGPASQRLMLRVGDQPRSITIGTQGNCVQLQHIEGNSEVIAAFMRAGPQPRDDGVRLVGPDISPNHRSTRGACCCVPPEKTGNVGAEQATGHRDAPSARSSDCANIDDALSLSRA